MKSLNQKIVANIGDMVWFLKLKHTIEEDINDSKVYFDEIYQGKVITVGGATGCSTCIDIIDINGNKYGAVQEIFFSDFNKCLEVFNIVRGKYFGENRKDWDTDYLDIVKSYISYDYELKIPYKKGDKINVIYKNAEYYNSMIDRVLFNFSDASKTDYYSWSNQVSLQVMIDEHKPYIEITKKDLPLLEEVKICRC